MEHSQMDRDAWLKHFQNTAALRDAGQWYLKAQHLLEQLELSLRSSKPPSDSQKHVLWLLVLRIRRYLLALSFMSIQTDERTFTHAIDGYHAIHKSLFEMSLEFAIGSVYLDMFQAEGDPLGLSLLERLQLHAEITSLKKNRQHRFRLPAWRAMQDKAVGTGLPMSVPPSAQAMMDAPLEEATERLKKLIVRVQGASGGIKTYRHWFPEKRRDGRYFVADGEDDSLRPKNCGSVEWLCKAVLAEHMPGGNHRDFWVSAYNNDYDLINLYTHPVMGYDDCFRGTAERSLDLAQMQMSIRRLFHEVVLPPLRAYFRDNWVGLVSAEDKLRQLDLNTSKTVLAFLIKIHQQDRENSPKDPNLWG